MNFSNPVAIVGNLLLFYAIYCGAYALFPHKLPAWKIALFSSVFILIDVLFCFLFYSYYAVRILLGNLIVFLPIGLFYGDRLKKRLLYFLTTLAAILMTEIICAFIWPKIEESEYLKVFSLYLPIAFCLIAIVVLCFYSANKKSVNLSNADAIVVVFLVLSQLVLLQGYVVYMHRSFTNLLHMIIGVTVAVLLDTIADVLLFRSMKRSVAAARLKAENEALNSQIISQQKYYSMLESQFTNIRQIRHDISNHMYTIKALLAEGNSKEASQYADDYLESVSRVTVSRICENPSANAFLVFKRGEMEAEGIQTDFSVQLAENCGVPGVDLITALGNLLDNAEESCRNLPQSLVKLRVESKDDMLMILTENPYEENREHAERIRGLNRGAGFAILSNLAEKYHGSFTYSSQDGLFRSAVTLQVDIYSAKRMNFM